MKSLDLCEVVPKFETYQSWQAVQTELETAAAEKPDISPDTTDVERLEIKLAYAKKIEPLKETVLATRQDFRHEVVDTSQLSTPYKIGVLAAMDHPYKPQRTVGGIKIDLIKGAPINKNYDMPYADFAWPSTNLLVQASRIGNTLADVERGLRHRKPTPVAELSLGRRQQDLTYPTEVNYLLAPRNGLTLKDPVTNPDGSISYTLHRAIDGVAARFNPMRARFEPLSDNPYRDHVRIPAIEQLLGSHAAGKLLIGRRALIFAAKYTARCAKEQREWEARNKETHPLDRIYN